MGRTVTSDSQSEFRLYTFRFKPQQPLSESAWEEWWSKAPVFNPELKIMDYGLFVTVSHLSVDKHVVDPLLCQQLLMCPLLHHDSSLEYSNAVCVLDGGQTVGHDDARPALAGLVQSFLHHLQREHGLIRAPTMNVFSTKDGFSLNQSCHLYQHGYFPVFLPSSSLMWTLSAQHFPFSCVWILAAAVVCMSWWLYSPFT